MRFIENSCTEKKRSMQDKTPLLLDKKFNERGFFLKQTNPLRLRGLFAVLLY